MPYKPLWCLLSRLVWQICNYQTHYQAEFNHGAKTSCKLHLYRDKSIRFNILSLTSNKDTRVQKLYSKSVPGFPSFDIVVLTKSAGF